MLKQRHWIVRSALVAALAPIACTIAPDRAERSGAVGSEVGASPKFTLFESGHVRPLALSPDGKQLFAVNTPDARLEIFDVKTSGLVHRGSVAVGLEPVAVVARDDDEVWVVNHLSDSVSVVDVRHPDRARVTRTLLVGDEPRDIVFAGVPRDRAFITTAHRGQNNPNDPQLLTPGVGRADVWVFDAGNLGTTLGGTPVAVITLFTDTPRGLAVTPDGHTVYAAGFQSGNRTTVVEQLVVEAGGGLPPPTTNFQGLPQPKSALIVKYDGAHWLDTIGRIWDDVVMFSLPDKDVFVIDATANPPAPVAGPSGFYSGVGTILFNLVVNPANGHVYVTNTEARNEHRFEGPGTFAGTSVRGHLHESRITVLAAGAVSPRHLNKHIDYTTCCAAVPNAETARSLALPLQMAISSDGATLYVAAFGSGKVGLFDTAQLENDTFVPSTSSQIPVTGGGPSGLVLDEARHRLYVMTRFDSGISIVDTISKQETQHLHLFNPEPASIVQGRPILYDTGFSSSHGDSSCATCHVFGDFDSLAWDLGNPDDVDHANPSPLIDQGVPLTDPTFKPLKGVMSTQSLRGMSNHGPMHWRGDRNGGGVALNVQPNGGIFDEDAAFKKFNGAFVDLLGRNQPISASDMQRFADFILQVSYPPNPIRNLDSSFTASQQSGREHFFSPGVFPSGMSCNDCHRLDPTFNADQGVPFPGLFGSNTLSALDTADLVAPQALKVPHLRNVYQKVGMFGLPDMVLGGFLGFSSTGFLGDQVRGFGVLHDGAFASLFNFMSQTGFQQPISPNGFLPGIAGDPKRRDVANFLLAFDSNLAPIVGQQVTLTQTNGAVAGPRIDLLLARAALGECELVARATVLDELGFLYDGAGLFHPNRHLAPAVSDATLRLMALLPSGALTYTCVPVGSGRRLGIDADLDGALDGDEEDAGSDPRDPGSTP